MPAEAGRLGRRSAVHRALGRRERRRVRCGWLIVLAGICVSAAGACGQAEADDWHPPGIPNGPAGLPPLLSLRTPLVPPAPAGPAPEREQTGPTGAAAQRDPAAPADGGPERRDAPPIAPRLPIPPTVNWTGQVQTDFVWFSQSGGNREAVGDIQDGVGFRRARLGVFGEIYDIVEYRIEFDFALEGRPTFLDNWVGAREIPFLEEFPLFGSIRIGHFFEPFSLERVTPNRFATFMERSLADHFAPARNTGFMTWNHAADGALTWSLGMFRSESDVFGDDVGNGRGWAGTGRVTWAPGFDPEDRTRLLHLGAAYSYRGQADRVTRFRERPEIRMRQTGVGSVPFFVDTGDIPARAHQLIGLETAVVRGPFSVQSELIIVPVDRLDGPNPVFYGAYVYGSYFLTGEHRPYFRTRAPFRRVTGVFDRVIPNTYALVPPGSRDAPRGIGAWEVAARWSTIDLNDRDLRGGRLNDVTLGLNWYLNPYARVTWNYIHAMLHDAAGRRSTADIFAVRFGFDF